ncbi:MAG TPA: carotenoid biosynthesis protein [Ferruginibacter sp.]|nr:carotenoid biosynthesis protein [Ferruginibacter sp.]HRE63360.1 carotenoid biosynthesis protein [Ferruginibacter sp.]
MNSFSKDTIATAIAILFHAVGLVGMLYFKSEWIVSTTPFHLLLMAGLLFYTQKKINPAFIIFFIACFVVGIVVEYIGTTTGILFGNYQYGNVLGPGIYNVPFIIGINWFIIIYCCGIAVHTLLYRLSSKLANEMVQPSTLMRTLSIVIDGATLAVFMDWLIEPVAIKLGYWQWLGNGEIPSLNYISWFVVSLLLLLIFHKLPFNKQNKFAIHLLLIQAMFFLLLRTFL